MSKPATIHGIFTIDDVDTRMLYKEFQQGVEIYNEVDWALISTFIRRTQKESVRVWQRNMEFTEAAEGYMETWQKIRALEIAIGLKDFELGFGFTKKALQDSTANELRETHSEALRADQRLMARRFFYACLTPGSGSTTKGWWDANMAAAGERAPPDWKGNTFLTSHSHYVASGSADLLLSDFTSLKRNIREHGYAGPLMCFMNTQEIEACENLAGWTTALTPTSIIETIAARGFEAVKEFQGFIIVRDDFMPAGYLMAIETKIQPLTMREPLNAAGRGLKLWEGPYSEYPLAEAYYGRRFDIAVIHRGAGAVRQITSGSWSTPSFTF